MYSGLNYRFDCALDFGLVRVVVVAVDSGRGVVDFVVAAVLAAVCVVRTLEHAVPQCAALERYELECAAAVREHVVVPGPGVVLDHHQAYADFQVYRDPVVDWAPDSRDTRDWEPVDSAADRKRSPEKSDFHRGKDWPAAAGHPLAGMLL